MKVEDILKGLRERSSCQGTFTTFSFVESDFDEIEKLVLKELGPRNMRFLERELSDWISGTKENPGKAYLEDYERWEPYLNKDQKFDYRYPERLGKRLSLVVKILKENPKSRRAYLSVWDREKDFPGEDKNVPCILGFHFYILGKSLKLNVMVRSLNVAYGGQILNDMWLTSKLLRWVLNHLPGISWGTVTFLVSNFHLGFWKEKEEK